MTDAALAELLAVVEPVGQAFGAAGHRAYLVGGIVRDHLLGRPVDGSADLDLTTDAVPADIKSVVAPLADAVWTQGERFGTIGCRIDGRVFEITTHRAERYEADSRKPDVDFSTDVRDDLSRRDFTINAMARALPAGDLVDPFDGQRDLDAGRLMTPIDPVLSFTDDPLRMLRAARFVATYGFKTDPAVEDAIATLVDRLEIVSAERTRDELLRLLQAADPAGGLELLRRTGLARVYLPELDEAEVSQVSTTAPDPLVRLAVILTPTEADTLRRRLEQLRLSNQQRSSITRMVTAVEGLAATDDESLRRFVVASRPDTDRAVALAVATDHPRAGELADSLARLLADEGADGFEPAVTGGQLIAELGLEPGPAVGEVMRWLGEERLRHGPMTVNESVAAARRWLDAAGH